MERKKLTGLYSVMQAVTWGGFGIIIAYASSYFLNCGLTNRDYGMLMALVCALAFVIQLCLSELISKLAAFTLKRTLTFIGLLMLICSAILIVCAGAALPLRIAIYCMGAVAIQLMPATVNALGIAGINDGYIIRFGSARGIGAIGYAVFSYLTGRLITVMGQTAIPVLFTVPAIMLIVSVSLFPDVNSRQEKEKGAKKQSSLLKSKSFAALLISSTALYLGHNFLCNFMLQTMQSRGGNEANQGIATAIAAVCELPVMFMFSAMLKKARCDTWLKLSGVFMSCKCIFTLIAASVPFVYGAQLWQLGGFSMYAVASVYYVGSTVSPEQNVRGQSMLGVTCTLSNLIAFAAGGWLLDMLGIQVLLAVSTAVSLLGAIGFFICLKPVYHTVGES